MTMKKPAAPKAILTEDAIQKDEALVARIKSAKPLEAMSANDFMAWLSRV